MKCVYCCCCCCHSLLSIFLFRLLVSKVVDDVIISQRQFEFVFVVLRLLFGPYLDALHITHVHSSLAQTHTRLDSLVCTTAHPFLFFSDLYISFILSCRVASLSLCVFHARLLRQSFTIMLIHDCPRRPLLPGQQEDS